MTEKSCELCKYRVVPLSRNPCKSCDKNYRHFTPIKPNYGSCRDNHLTTNGDCDVYHNTWPCLQWDCGSWSNEPAKAKPDDDHERLMALVREYARLAKLYADSQNADLKCVWFEHVRPAMWDRIEARARAALGGE